MRIALVSSCTNRKKQIPTPELQARNLSQGSLAALADEWVHRVEQADKAISARDLYAGRAFTEALAAAKAGGGDCYMISAGLGLVSVDELVPSYSLTVTGNGEDNVLRKVPDSSAKPAQWWEILNRKLGSVSPVARLIEEQQDRLFILALPSAYLELIGSDLAGVSATARARIRIIGLPTLKKSIPAALQGSFVAYDERLEAADAGRAGTRSDFPQRAARHFISDVLVAAPFASAQEHAAQASVFLDKYARPPVPNRQRYTDDTLKNIIRGLWVESQGRVTNGLRLLRRERQIACEQSRFKRLFWEIAAEKGTQQ
jgi:hypothetical protein